MKREVKLKAIRQPKGKEEKTMKVYFNFKEKGSAKLGYLVTCHLRNGNIIPAFTDAFSSAMTIADMFNSGEYTVKVEILKISTGSIFRYVV